MKKLFILACAALGMLACTGQNDPSNPDNPSTPTIEGELSGVFSVSASKKVRFSQGNLQYQASTDTWRFAKYQYEYCGAANEMASPTYGGWIDLFGWGTSGYNNRHPYMRGFGEEQKEDTLSNDITGTNYDWGVYNKISNGGDKTNMWRTLTGDEWEYLLRGRIDAEYLFGLATVNGVYGLIILPDNWKTPSDLTFNASITKGLVWEENEEYNYKLYGNPSENANNYNDNIYNTAEWTKMESAGAIFLPSGGLWGNDAEKYGYNGRYWSSTFGCIYGDSYGTSIYICSSGLYPNQVIIAGKCSVRLVNDVK